ncbi:hypothetical protein [Gilvimarinus sp. DA14]|uniref:hypothetical protein n=1 Tax=Gilvimarinus sp. DA14 TaxID=2956798 RepID=UPI0020B8D4A9|nr:hypothetical protein [Gilvimarinus sp. DA14]UTF60609.1 hypothetical protein NHM04_02090 [Gilvimarinus sp. DA14]
MQRKMETLLQRVTDLQVDVFHQHNKHKEQQVFKLKHRAAHLGTQLALRQITGKI